MTSIHPDGRSVPKLLTAHSHLVITTLYYIRINRMTKFCRRAPLLLLTFCATLAAISAARAEERTHYPVTIRNCGSDVTFDRAPQRAVSIGQGSTEILLSLGLAARMVGTAVWFEPVQPQFAAANATIPRLADNDPSFESVVARKPDLVAAQFTWHVGPHGAVGTRAQFAALGIPTYVSPADCEGKDNSGDGDGVRTQNFSMALIYREIREMAEIFDVNAAGDALVARLQAREAAAQSAVRAAGVSALFWFSSRTVQGDAFIAGGTGAAAAMLRTLGARNVVTAADEWPLVSWETIAAANPDVIVIATMSRRRFPADDPAVKEHFLETDPVASRLNAVRQHHVLVMDAQAMSPTIRAIDGLEILSSALEKFGFAK